MKKFLLILMFLPSVISAQADNGKWKVEKEYDENGNLIRYDSIYSNTKTFSLSSADIDSLMKEFSVPFASFHDSIMNKFKDPRWEDFGTQWKDMQDGFQLQFDGMKDFMKRMDSLELEFEKEFDKAIKEWERNQKKDSKKKDKEEGVRI